MKTSDYIIVGVILGCFFLPPLYRIFTGKDPIG